MQPPILRTSKAYGQSLKADEIHNESDYFFLHDLTQALL